MAYISFEKYGPEYQSLWDTMHIIRDGKELQRLSDKIKLSEQMYRKVQVQTGVPWQMVAVIHEREAGEQDIGRWLCVLHNGEKIVGTDKKTKEVPAGRGPFHDWVSAAVDALRLQGFDKYSDWTVARVLWALEPFNGYGYRNGPVAKGVKYPPMRSPYVWGSTNHQQVGKYVADHVFDPNVMDSQIGCAALLKYLNFGGITTPPPVTPTVPVNKPTEPTGEVKSFGWIDAIKQIFIELFKRK
jgi:lysozyme family protein